ncbi:MAG: glutathione S-transferase N-terminal domain-containing protein [Gammaproteobacteria bacterium]|nr:glutathione S-transferase N-terminal domain-containing protein [Gammaproteobacteria bacterium]
MRFFIRWFFRTLRIVLTPIVLTINWLTTPKGVTREATEQVKVDQQTAQLKLYQFQACPFCIKVRREMQRLSLNIELRDAQKDMTHREDLIAGGGEWKVPCLQITDDQGNQQWLYESDEIILHLRERFA